MNAEILEKCRSYVHLYQEARKARDVAGQSDLAVELAYTNGVPVQGAEDRRTADETVYREIMRTLNRVSTHDFVNALCLDAIAATERKEAGHE